MARLSLPLCLALAVLVARGAAAAPVDYELDASKSHLVGRLFRAGVAARLAHDHVIEARQVKGTIRLDTDHPEQTRIAIAVEARQLRPDGPALRRLYKLSPLGSDEIAKILRHMQSPGQLFVGRYRAIAFASRRVRPLGNGRYRVEGELTIRGVKRRVSLEVEARLSGDRLKGKGQLRFKQSSFGYAPFSAVLGLIKVRDDALIDIYLEAKARR